MGSKKYELTDEHLAQFKPWADRWIANGLSCEPANFEAAEAGIRGCYMAAGRACPQIVRVGSPIVACVAGPVVEKVDQSVRQAVYQAVGQSVYQAVDQAVGQSVYQAVDQAVRQSVGQAVRQAVGQSVRHAVYQAVYQAVDQAVDQSVGQSVDQAVGQSVRQAVYQSVGQSVGRAVGHAVYQAVYQAVDQAVRHAVYQAVYQAVDQSVRHAVYQAVYRAVDQAVDQSVGQSVRQSVRQAVGQSVGQSVGETIWRSYRAGNLWAAWCAYVSFFRDVMGFQHESLAAFAHEEKHALNAGWCWYGEKVAMLSDRPKVINLRRNQLHCESGPSIEWRDGWRLWHIEGVAVSEQIVMSPHTLTVEKIDAENNEEVRRIMIERFGWIRFLAESGAKSVDARRNERDAQDEALYLTNDARHRFVCCDPSTGRKYVLGVPREVKTCEQAQAYLSHGLDKFAIHRC